MLTILSETAREMGLSVFTDLPNAFVAVLAERLGMDWNGRTLMGEMLADLMDVPWEKLAGQLPGAAPGEETAGRWANSWRTAWPVRTQTPHST